MRRTFSLLGAIAGLFLTLLVGAPASQASGYTPTVPASCTIGAPSVTVGNPVKLTIEVSATGVSSVTGDVAITISTAAAKAAANSRAAGTVVWTKTARYTGTPLKITGPKLPAGRYSVAFTFTPDNAQITSCTNSAAFRVTEGDTGGESDGSLPDTGGPHLYALLLGLGLVAGGTGIVGRNRRRSADA